MVYASSKKTHTMLKRFVTFIFVIFLCPVFGQNIKIKGRVLDVDGDPAYNISIAFDNSPKSVFKTKRNGEFEVEFTVGKQDSLHFRSVAFDSYTLELNKRLIKKAGKNNGVYEVDIIMPDKTIGIVYVTPDLPDTIVGKDYSVEDFEYTKDGQLVLLTYEKNLKKGAMLRMLDQNLDEVDKYYIPGNAIELSKDYRGHIHLLAEERVFYVKTMKEDMQVFLEDRDYYFKYVAPIIDTIADNIYFSNYSDVYPAFDYYEFNLKDSTYNVILEVEDTFMMEFYRAEFKYVDVRTKIWAHQKQIETGIDKEIWVGATVFTNSLYYNPVYAPLFKTGEDTIIVYDHYKNRMFRYTPESGFVDSTRISYHLQERKSGWEQPLLQDKVQGKVYAMFEKNGFTYLREISKTTGHVKKSFKLHFKYVDRIQIIDGQVYYVYRPFESVQKKFIYRENIDI